jgi:hypothetical protein
MTTEPPNVHFLPPTPSGPDAAGIDSTYVQTARAIAAICATRMLLMIAVITGAAIWGYTIWDPSRDRLYAAIAFSLVFVGPLAALYHRKG